jgi:hypothetical protein
VVASDLRNFVKSKQDLYIILTIEGQLHLPPYDDCTMEFMRDALSGKKKLLTNRDLCPVTVPRYLPDPSATKVINRKFLFNVSKSLNQTAGHQHGQAWLVSAGDREGSNRSEAEAGADTEQVHHYERGHVQADHDKQPRVQR